MSAASRAGAASGQLRLGQWLSDAPGAFYLLALMALLLSVLTPDFFSLANLTNVALQVAVLMIVSFGMTLVILTEGIDLSVGPVIGLCGVVMAVLAVSGWPLAAALAVALVVGLAIGLANGVLVAYVGMPPFIVTLGAFGVAQSGALVLSAGGSVTGLPEAIRWFNEGTLLAVPVPIIVTVLCFALTYGLLYHTKFGRYTFAIGGNRRALILSGSPARFYQAAVYAYAGLLTAIASFIMTARMNAAHPTVGVGMEFDAIAAVILGGTSFEKGRGGLVGTVIGALAVGVLRNGLNLLDVGTEWQVAVVGLVIILAVGVDSLRGARW